MVTKKKASLYIPFFFSFSKLFCKGLNINYKYATSLFYFLLIFNFRNYFEYFKNSLILFLLLIIFRHCLLLRIQEGVPVILISIPSRIQVQVHLQY